MPLTAAAEASRQSDLQTQITLKAEGTQSGNISVGNAEADGLDVSEFADLFTDRLFYIWED